MFFVILKYFKSIVLGISIIEFPTFYIGYPENLSDFTRLISPVAESIPDGEYSVTSLDAYNCNNQFNLNFSEDKMESDLNSIAHYPSVNRKPVKKKQRRGNIGNNMSTNIGNGVFMNQKSANICDTRDCDHTDEENGIAKYGTVNNGDGRIEGDVDEADSKRDRRNKIACKDNFVNDGDQVVSIELNDDNVGDDDQEEDDDDDDVHNIDESQNEEGEEEDDEVVGDQYGDEDDTEVKEGRDEAEKEAETEVAMKGQTGSSLLQQSNSIKQIDRKNTVGTDETVFRKRIISSVDETASVPVSVTTTGAVHASYFGMYDSELDSE